jgi:hypothetical protein
VKPYIPYAIVGGVILAAVVVLVLICSTGPVCAASKTPTAKPSSAKPTATKTRPIHIDIDCD